MTAPVSLARGRASLPPVEDRILPAIGLLLLALLAFTGIDTCAKWLVLHGLPATEAAFVRYAVHLAVVCAVGFAGAERVWVTANLGAVSVRAVALLGSTLLNFAALSFLPLTMTAAIMFSAPLWICLLSIPLLGEKVGRRRWAAMAVGFCGILVVARPWTGHLHPAILLSLAAALCASLYAILTRMLAGRDPTNTQQFYAGLVATLGVAPFALGDWTWPTGGASWLAFAAIGLFGWSGHQLVTIAHRFAPASTLAPFNYAQIVYMTASSWLIFAQPPDRWVIIGAGVVAASGLYIGLRERALARRPTRGKDHER
ncbi:MAG TPA: DMT family transporter [Amaricoccus sp.]|nr:DMT family transporter [Amaricoccus sp.]